MRRFACPNRNRQNHSRHFEARNGSDYNDKGSSCEVFADERILNHLSMVCICSICTKQCLAWHSRLCHPMKVKGIAKLQRERLKVNFVVRSSYFFHLNCTRRIANWTGCVGCGGCSGQSVIIY